MRLEYVFAMTARGRALEVLTNSLPEFRLNRLTSSHRMRRQYTAALLPTTWLGSRSLHNDILIHPSPNPCVVPVSSPFLHQVARCSSNTTIQCPLMTYLGQFIVWCSWAQVPPPVRAHMESRSRLRNIHQEQNYGRTRGQMVATMLNNRIRLCR